MVLTPLRGMIEQETSGMGFFIWWSNTKSKSLFVPQLFFKFLRTIVSCILSSVLGLFVCFPVRMVNLVLTRVESSEVSCMRIYLQRSSTLKDAVPFSLVLNI